MQAELIGVPPVVTEFEGLDRIGARCRIDPSVSVMRFGDSVEPRVLLGDDCGLYAGTRMVVGDLVNPRARLALGSRVLVNVGAYLSGEGGLEVGDDVLIGPHACLLSAGHQAHNGPLNINANPLTYGQIKVGSGAWIGAGAIVLQGVEIGEGAVIGAGSVVTRNVPPAVVVVGNPARVVHARSGVDGHHAMDDYPEPRSFFRRWWARLRP
ncbi:MAG: acyltransferase [Halothiobacillaceae bacterium]